MLLELTDDIKAKHLLLGNKNPGCSTCKYITWDEWMGDTCCAKHNYFIRKPKKMICDMYSK